MLRCAGGVYCTAVQARPLGRAVKAFERVLPLLGAGAGPGIPATTQAERSAGRQRPARCHGRRLSTCGNLTITHASNRCLHGVDLRTAARFILPGSLAPWLCVAPGRAAAAAAAVVAGRAARASELGARVSAPSLGAAILVAGRAAAIYRRRRAVAGAPQAVAVRELRAAAPLLLHLAHRAAAARDGRAVLRSTKKGRDEETRILPKS